jgi:hypothetical protein
VDLTSKLAALAIGKTFKYKTMTLDSVKLKEFIGLYENEKRQQRILTVTGNKLYSQIGRGPKSLINAYQKDKFFFDKDSMLTIAFSRNTKGNIEKLVTESLRGNEVWMKTNKPIPSQNGIKLEEIVLEKYVGQYEVTPQFTFVITKEESRLFLQAKGQEKLEMFAESESEFFLKVNDARFEFVKDDSGKVVKVIMNQGGRKADAKKVN